MKLTIKDVLAPKNIRDFIKGNYMMWKDQLTSKGISKHIKEQAIYRALLCRPCLVNGKCSECGCKTPNMFFSVHKTDSLNKWGQMLGLEDWEAFKRDNDIDELPDSFELIKEIEDDRHTRKHEHSEELLGSKSDIPVD